MQTLKSSRSFLMMKAGFDNSKRTPIHYEIGVDITKKGKADLDRIIRNLQQRDATMGRRIMDVEEKKDPPVETDIDGRRNNVLTYIEVNHKLLVEELSARSNSLRYFSIEEISFFIDELFAFYENIDFIQEEKNLVVDCLCIQVEKTKSLRFNLIESVIRASMESRSLLSSIGQVLLDCASLRDIEQEQSTTSQQVADQLQRAGQRYSMFHRLISLCLSDEKAEALREYVRVREYISAREKLSQNHIDYKQTGSMAVSTSLKPRPMLTVNRKIVNTQRIQSILIRRTKRKKPYHWLIPHSHLLDQRTFAVLESDSCVSIWSFSNEKRLRQFIISNTHGITPELDKLSRTQLVLEHYYTVGILNVLSGTVIGPLTRERQRKGITATHCNNEPSLVLYMNESIWLCKWRTGEQETLPLSLKSNEIWRPVAINQTGIIALDDTNEVYIYDTETRSLLSWLQPQRADKIKGIKPIPETDLIVIFGGDWMEIWNWRDRLCHHQASCPKGILHVEIISSKYVEVLQENMLLLRFE